MGAQCLFEFTFVFMTRLWKPETFIYEGVSESFRTGLLERELQMVQLSATKYSCIAIWWVSLVSCTTLTLCVASRIFVVVVYFVMSQSGNFLIYPHIKATSATIMFFFFISGDFGTYQLRQSLLHMLAALTAGLHMLSLVTVAAVPEHR